MKCATKQTLSLLLCAAIFAGCSSPTHSSSPTSETKVTTTSPAATQVLPAQLETGFTLNLDNWLKERNAESFNTELTIRRDSSNNYLITTHFLQPVKLGVGGFDATGLGRFTMCFSNDLALRRKAAVWLFVGLKADLGKTLETSQVQEDYLILLQPDDPALKLLQKNGLKATLKELQKRYPLYDIAENSFHATDDPLYQGAYCGFYKSNFTN